jgi:uncharacterized membrane protein required for colicin V production
VLVFRVEGFNLNNYYMIAVATQSFELDHLPIGWFDLVLVVVLGFGLFRGRRNGMTKEVLPLFFWVATVLVCGLFYEMSGELLINLTGWGALICNLAGYLGLMFLVYLLYYALKQFLTPRLTGSNFFGSGEYYLGMASGLIRYACIVFVALALLNAPHYTAADIAQTKAFNARWFGGGQQGFSGDFFPTVQSVQAATFEKAFTGRYIKQYAGVMLINTAPADMKTASATPQKQPIIHIGN